MKVVIQNKAYQMGKTEFHKMIKEVVKPNIKRGIYAIEKGSYGELLNKTYKTQRELYATVKVYQSMGYKVYFNK